VEIIIVQPYGHLSGHYSLYTHRLCSALVEQGHQLHLLSSHGFRDQWTNGLPLVHEAVARSDRVQRILKRLKGRWLRSRFECWSVQRRGFELLKGHPQRVLHILDFEPLTLGVLNRLYGRPKQVLTLAGADYTFHHYYNGNVVRGCYGALSRLCVADITRNMLTVVHAERLEAVARDRGLLRGEGPTLIPWGMDPKVDGMSQELARKTLGLDERCVVALMFGALRRVKGLDDLIEAVARLGRNELLFLVVGERMSTLGFDPLVRVAERGCSEQFAFHMRYVPDDEMSIFFRAADFAVLPYKATFHGESGVLAHTAEYGLPVVASDTGELGKRVREHRLGLVFEPENVSSLTAALQRLATLSPEESCAMRAHVARYAASHSWAQVAERHVEVYQRAAAR
jgi:glycosyltransferase involved in cell wall biosynthesis